jgi:hypothetical protein
MPGPVFSIPGNFLFGFPSGKSIVPQSDRPRPVEKETPTKAGGYQRSYPHE